MNANNRNNNRTRVEIEAAEYISELRTERTVMQNLATSLVRLEQQCSTQNQRIIDTRNVELENERTNLRAAEERINDLEEQVDNSNRILAQEVRDHQNTKDELERVRQQLYALSRLRMRNPAV